MPRCSCRRVNHQRDFGRRTKKNLDCLRTHQQPFCPHPRWTDFRFGLTDFLRHCPVTQTIGQRRREDSHNDYPSTERWHIRSVRSVDVDGWGSTHLSGFGCWCDRVFRSTLRPSLSLVFQSRWFPDISDAPRKRREYFSIFSVFLNLWFSLETANLRKTLERSDLKFKFENKRSFRYRLFLDFD